jgi:histidine triad (HIT) family protein
MTAHHSTLNIIAPMTEQDCANRRALDQRCAALIAQGMCPYCHQFATGNLFPGQREQTYYQDALLSCHLETYPRSVGHTIMVARSHYADIAKMPIDLGGHIMRVTHALVTALKRVVGANKVYMHTMYSGDLSHLHFQFIPRRPGELIGGRVFAAERGVLTSYHVTLQALHDEVRALMR